MTLTCRDCGHDLQSHTDEDVGPHYGKCSECKPHGYGACRGFDLSITEFARWVARVEDAITALPAQETDR